MSQAFASSVEHLLAELERIDLLIRARVAHLRRVHGEDEHFRGLYIPEHEVDALLCKPLGVPQWLEATQPSRWAQIEARLQALDEALQARKREAMARGVELRLEQLRRLFGLERLEIDALLVCMAAELDLRYEKLYAYLQDDVTRKRPTTDLVLNLLTASPYEHLAARRHFLPESALRRGRLIEPIDDPQQAQPTLLSTPLKPDDRIVQYLLGSDSIDARLQAFAQLVEPSRDLDSLMLDADLRRGLGTLLARSPGAGGAPVIHLTGPAGVGKQSIAATLCRERGLKLLVVRVDAPAHGGIESRGVAGLDRPRGQAAGRGDDVQGRGRVAGRGSACRARAVSRCAGRRRDDLLPERRRGVEWRAAALCAALSARRPAAAGREPARAHVAARAGVAGSRPRPGHDSRGQPLQADVWADRGCRRRRREPGEPAPASFAMPSRPVTCSRLAA